MKIKLGLGNAHAVDIDLDKLIESRLLVQANSGGGKSWAIRRIVEQSFGKKQIIILDPEGEFGNLRSEFDFVYAGKGGDAPVESRSAALLAHRLLELKASTIVDLYELPPHERKHFVRLFCEALVNAPKELWHDVLIIIDEAHVFAPEKGESEAMGPVIDLATRGRKRGFCVVLATQRLPKLNKDAAAECNNKLIGRASQDIDRKRAAEELGFTTKEQILSLRDLNPGEFYAFGPAISREVTRVVIGDVHVKPAKRGVERGHIAAPSDKVKAILGRLSDLPQEAQKEATTVAELKAQLVSIQAENRRLISSRPAPAPTGYTQTEMDRALKARNTEWKVRIDEAVREIKRLSTVVSKISSIIEGQDTSIAITMPPELIRPVPMVTVSAKQIRPVPETIKDVETARHIVSSDSITNPEQRILDAIAWTNAIGIEQPENSIIAFLAGYTNPRSSGYKNPRANLIQKGFITYPSANLVRLTDAGTAQANHPRTPGTEGELQSIVLARLTNPQARILKPLIEARTVVDNETLAAAAGYSNPRSSGYKNPRADLIRFGLAEYIDGGVKASSVLFF